MYRTIMRYHRQSDETSLKQRHRLQNHKIRFAKMVMGRLSNSPQGCVWLFLIQTWYVHGKMNIDINVPAALGLLTTTGQEQQSQGRNTFDVANTQQLWWITKIEHSQLITQTIVSQRVCSVCDLCVTEKFYLSAPQKVAILERIRCSK